MQQSFTITVPTGASISQLLSKMPQHLEECSHPNDAIPSTATAQKTLSRPTSVRSSSGRKSRTSAEVHHLLLSDYFFDEDSSDEENEDDLDIYFQSMSTVSSAPRVPQTPRAPPRSRNSTSPKSKQESFHGMHQRALTESKTIKNIALRQIHPRAA